MGYGIFGLKRHAITFFVGSYGSELTRGVYVFQLDVDNGEIIKRRQYYKSTANPTYMTRAERFIYTCYKNNSGRTTDGGIWQYAAMDVQFGLTARVHNEGKTYEHCVIDDKRSALYAVDYYNGEVCTVPIKKMKVVKFSQTIKHEGKSIDEKKQDRPHPIYVAFNPEQTKVIVCDLGTDELVYYSIMEDGKLERDNEHTIHVKSGNGPRKIKFSKNGKYAYVLNEIANTIEVYENNNDALTLIQTVDTYPKDSFDKASAAGDMTIMESEEYLFASNRGHDSVSVFEINHENGKLEFIEFVDTDENPRVLKIFQDRWLLVASQKGESLETWEIKPKDRHGVLFETNYSYTIAEPVTICMGNQNYIDASKK